MKFRTRLLIWLTVAILVPIGIFIYERGYNRDAMIWIIGVTLLAVIVEGILKWKNRKV